MYLQVPAPAVTPLFREVRVAYQITWQFILELGSRHKVRLAKFVEMDVKVSPKPLDLSAGLGPSPFNHESSIESQTRYQSVPKQEESQADLCGIQGRPPAASRALSPLKPTQPSTLTIICCVGLTLTNCLEIALTSIPCNNDWRSKFLRSRPVQDLCRTDALRMR